MKTYEENFDEAMDRIARGYKVTNRKVIITDRSWQMSSYGCRECLNVRMESVYEAYEESKISYEW